MALTEDEGILAMAARAQTLPVARSWQDFEAEYLDIFRAGR